MGRGSAAAVALLALTCGAHADAGASIRDVDAVQRFVLPNGLTVVLAVDHRTPLVGMELRYRIGSRDEPASRPGIAGLAQRMMVRATTHLREGDYDRYLDEAGGSDSRWTTTVDHTSFRVTVPPEHVALPLWLWSDQMGFFADRIDDAFIAQQLQVMLNERVQLRDNVPGGNVHDVIDAELFPAGHPYHAGRLRGAAGLRGLTTAELRAFVTSRYTPDRATLIMTGELAPSRTRALVEKYFGTLRPARAQATRWPDPAPLVGEVRLQVAARVEAPSVSIAWRTPAYFHPGDAELDVLAMLLVGRRAGWLRWKLVDHMKIAVNVTAHQTSNELGSVFRIDAIAARGHSTGELVQAIDFVLRAVQSTTPDPFSARCALAELQIENAQAAEHKRAVTDLFNQCEVMKVQSGCIDAVSSRYASIDAARLAWVAAQALPLDRRVVVEVTPSANAPIAGEVRGRSAP